jgi:hypothetical protein
MEVDWTAARAPLRAGLTDSYGLVWTAVILLRSRWSPDSRSDSNDITQPAIGLTATTSLGDVGASELGLSLP